MFVCDDLVRAHWIIIIKLSFDKVIIVVMILVIWILYCKSSRFIYLFVN